MPHRLDKVHHFPDANLKCWNTSWNTTALEMRNSLNFGALSGEGSMTSTQNKMGELDTTPPFYVSCVYCQRMLALIAFSNVLIKLSYTT